MKLTEKQLKTELLDAISYIHSAASNAVNMYPTPVVDIEKPLASEKFVMGMASNSSQDQLRCVLSIVGDMINHADISLKLHKHPNVIYHTTITQENPWKLQQIQDSGNYLCLAVQMAQEVVESDKCTVEECYSILTECLSYFDKCRNSLLLPKKKTMDELLNSKNMRLLSPSLPGDLAISFYLQGPKLVFSVYHLTHTNQGVRFETLQGESSVPWIAKVLTLLSLGSQVGHQMKDKADILLSTI